MFRFIVIFCAVIFLAGSANAFPSLVRPVAPDKGQLLEVRLTKSNACKPKYRHRKSARELREKAHCK
jgi:hypothetical protein